MVNKKIIVSVNENILRNFDSKIRSVDRSKIIEALIETFLEETKHISITNANKYLTKVEKSTNQKSKNFSSEELLKVITLVAAGYLSYQVIKSIFEEGDRK